MHTAGDLNEIALSLHARDAGGGEEEEGRRKRCKQDLRRGSTASSVVSLMHVDEQAPPQLPPQLLLQPPRPRSGPLCLSRSPLPQALALATAPHPVSP